MRECVRESVCEGESVSVRECVSKGERERVYALDVYDYVYLRLIKREFLHHNFTF